MIMIVDRNDIFLPNVTEADTAIPLALNNNIIGFGFLFFKGDQAVVMRMVDPDYQGRGYGRLILDKLEDIATKKGSEKLVSVVNDTPSARNALLDAGFFIDWEADGSVSFVKDIN